MRPIKFFSFYLICSFFVFIAVKAEESQDELSRLIPMGKKLEKKEAVIEKKKKPKRKLAYQKKRRRWQREKETEGSKALGRFKASSVLKSKYRYKGRELEVDTD